MHEAYFQTGLKIRKCLLLIRKTRLPIGWIPHKEVIRMQFSPLKSVDSLNSCKQKRKLPYLEKTEDWLERLKLQNFFFHFWLSEGSFYMIITYFISTYRKNAEKPNNQQPL